MSIILKEHLEGLCPPEVTSEIVAKTVEKSAVMNLAKAVEMKTAEKTFPVFLSKPGAYFVNEGQRIHADKATFANVTMRARKLAIIVPISREALNDSVIDVMNEVKGQIAESFAVKFDNAALYSDEFGKSIHSVAMDRGNIFVAGSVEGQDLAGDISDTMALVEDAGYDVNGFVTLRRTKNALRKLRDADGNRIYVENLKSDGAVNELYGVPIEFVSNEVTQYSNVGVLAGDWNYAYYGILDDIRYDVLKEATLQNYTYGVDGLPLSLAEQDMIAIRATMRVGFVIVQERAFASLEPQEEIEP